MAILLNDEEIRNCWPAGQRKGYTPTPFDYAIRQAQLKKVVEWVMSRDLEYFNEDFGDWAHLKQGWESNATHMAIPIEGMEALKEEASIDESISR